MFLAADYLDGAVVAEHFAAAVGCVDVEKRALLTVGLLALVAGVPLLLHFLRFLHSRKAPFADVARAGFYSVQFLLLLRHFPLEGL